MLEFDVPEERVNVPELPFKISGETFVMRMPKLANTAGILALVQDDGELDIRRHGGGLARVMLGLVDYVAREEPEPDWIPGDEIGEDGGPMLVPNPRAGRLRGRARLQQRLMDTDDALDLQDLSGVFQAVIRVLMNRPTGPLPGSSEQRESTGSGSEAATPGKLAATS